MIISTIVTDCAVCLFPIEKKQHKITCSNNTCNCVMCHECLESMIDYCKTDNTLPNCPNIKCRRDYLYTDLTHLSRELVIKYSKQCYEYLKLNKTDEISIQKNKQHMLDKIRKDRHAFITQTFPKSIIFIIEIALKNKRDKITKNNKNHVEESLKKSFVKCFNFLCTNGILTYDKHKGTCNICVTTFCELCEKKITENVKHVCNQSDLDTINYTNTLVKCPKCLIPCIRSYGCNNITCAVCKTNFDYITGKKTNHGNHDDVSVKLNKTSYKPSVYYIKVYPMEIIYLFREIEDFEPENEPFGKILNMLNTMDCKIVNDRQLLSLASYFSKNQLHIFKKQLYTKYLLIIQENHEKNTITPELLKSIIEKLSE